MIPIQAGDPLGRQVFQCLRAAITSGDLRPGERLPSTRDLSEQIGVSRTIILNAFEQLHAEGYVEGRPGSGTYVSPGISVNRSEREETDIELSRYGDGVASVPASVDLPRQVRPLRYDFAYGRGDSSDFPFQHWRRLLAKRARKLSARDLDYGDAEGNPDLRDAICSHVRRSRGVACDPDQIIITSGSQQAIDLIVRMLVDPGDVVAIEDPHYQGARAILQASGAKLLPVPVDSSGLDPARLPPKARALFLTPSHQFPTGTVIPLSRRLSVLEWANCCEAIVIEDDYDGEFRYDGQPLESLQGLDAHGRVLYVGTFSRTIFPALRIGYLVVPKSLAAVFGRAKWLADRHTASLEQGALADFIAGGAYELYLRRARRGLSARREALLDAIAKGWDGKVRLTGAGSGAHIVLWPGGNFDEAEAVTKAAARDVGVYSISGYYLDGGPPGLLLGYSQLSVEDIREGIARLADVIEPVH